ncbi:MAG: hypothetical protein K2I93_01140, partial [Oscillospiraceae bacterium]|nr:hypothetical protein [Oscillospiraceae bacterium]
MFKQDYIMRQIQQLVQALVKILFNIDADSTSSALIQDMETKAAADDLLRKIDSGNIHEAENELSELLENRTMDNLLVGIVFYSYLNEKDDQHLEIHDFSRAEVESGIKHLLSEYG